MNLLVINKIFIEILIFNYDYKYLCFYSSRILLMPFIVPAQNHILTSPFMFPIALCDHFTLPKSEHTLSTDR